MKLNEQYFDGVLRLVVDDVPVPIFLVDDDVRILEFNVAARELLDAETTQVHHQRGGEALHCLHATDVAAGCGHGPACQTCVIRNSVKTGLRGKQVVRCQHNLELLRNGRRLRMDVLITAAPFPYHQTQLVLLVIEPRSDVTKDNKSQLPISGWSALLAQLPNNRQ